MIIFYDDDIEQGSRSKDDARLASVVSLLRGFYWRAPALANNPHLSDSCGPCNIYILAFLFKLIIFISLACAVRTSILSPG